MGRRYRLLSPVGRGGMGMVWHAHDVLLDRDVAVKELILPLGLDHAGTQVAHRRMLREARSAARLSHPGIVTVHDVVEEDGRPWIVMELVRAWSLEQAVRQSGPLPVVQAAEIGVRVLDALRHAHAAGILHRDVKPGNVLLTADRVVLTDFGIAAIEGDVTITQTGLLMGSPAYIPPERLQGRPITHAADLWSFGATLYAAVEGRPPYEGPDAVAVLGAVLTQEPNRAQRAGALLPVIEGLLRKNPADRMPAVQAAELLERVLRTHGSGLPVRGLDGLTSTPLPTRDDSTPVGMLPPLDPPSGPLPSRIIETPSGPVRVPAEPSPAPSRDDADRFRRRDGEPGMPFAAPAAYDALGAEPPRPPSYDSLRGATGPYETSRGPADPYDALRSPSGPQTYDALRSPSGSQSYDAPRGASGAQPDPYDALRSPSGQQPNPYDALRSPTGPQTYDGLRSPSGPQGYDATRSPSGPQAYDALRSPSGPRPDPYDALRSPSGPQPDPYDALRSPSGPQTYDALRSPSGPQGYDATRSPSGPQAYDALRSPSGPRADDPRGSRPDPYDALRGPSGPDRDLPGDGGRSAGDVLVAGVPGARDRSPNLADRLARDIENPFGGPEPRRRDTRDDRRDRGRNDAPRRVRVDDVRDDGRDDTREGRSPVLMILAGAGIVGVVAALLFVLWPSDPAPRDDAAPAPPAATSAEPSTNAATGEPPAAGPEEGGGSADVPSGFRARTAAGVSVAVPEDWTASVSDAAVTYIGPKSSGRRIQIKRVASTGDDGLAALTKTKDEATLTDYAQTRLESSSFGDYQASVWEYTYTALTNVTTHAVTRHITVNGETAYEVTFTAPDAEWDQADNRQALAVLWNTFKPSA
ncbi:protein kinase domain-containing protein [Sphaerisporangium aureirubrum]|uniref:non-specific serine/threonine protein kinase n=1 Tax=Sphaerisporangium aureirubrum TaxID=1544736 RepID=A0ABW1NTZ2_9ACTN